MRAFIATTREVMLSPAATGRRIVRLGPPALHDGRGLGQGRAGRLRAALPGRPRLPDRGARQLVPGLPDQRQRPRGHRHARDRDALVGALPPDRSGHRRARSRTRRSPSPRRGPRRSSATPRSRSIRTTRATRQLVGRLVRIPFVERDVPIIADDVVDPAFGTGAVKITPAHDHDDHETGLRHGLPAPTILADDATVTGTGTRYDGLDRFEARAAIVADLEARRRPRRRPCRTRWSSGAASAATTSSSRGSRPSGSSGRRRSRNGRSRRPAAAGRGSSPSDSRRPGSTG